MAEENLATPATETESIPGLLSEEEAVNILMKKMEAGAENDETVDSEADTEVELEAHDQTEEEVDEAELGDSDTLDADDHDEELMDSDDSDEPESDSQEELIEVKAYGETFKVTLDELKKGYSREQDYSRKTQELGEHRRKLDKIEQDNVNLQQHYQAQLHALRTIAENVDPVLAEGAKTDWAKLARDNPNEYTRKKAEYDQKLQLINTLDQQQQAQQQEQQVAMEKERQKVYNDEMTSLLEKVPEWKDESVSKKDFSAISSNLVNSYGFTEQEINSVLDHRILLMARDATKWNNFQNTKKSAASKKTVKKAGVKVQKPGVTRDVSEKNINVKKLHDRFKQTGKEEDLLAYLNASDKYKSFTGRE